MSNAINTIFVSHSTIDKSYALKVIEFLEEIKNTKVDLFFSSLEAYSIPPGKNFTEHIKDTLNKNVLVLFVLSGNFYKSTMCMCEMGATWVKGHTYIPILIPPFDFSNIQGPIVGTQAIKINNKANIKSLYSQIVKILGIEHIDPNILDRLVEKFINEINELLGHRYQHGQLPKGSLFKEKIEPTPSLKLPSIPRGDINKFPKSNVFSNDQNSAKDTIPDIKNNIEELKKAQRAQEIEKLRKLIENKS